MEETPSGRNLEDFIVMHAEVFEKDREIISLLTKQNKIAYDDPVEASKIQAELNFLRKEYAEQKDISLKLLGPLRLSQSLVLAKLDGRLIDFSSEKARDFIRHKLNDLNMFYGVK